MSRTHLLCLTLAATFATSSLVVAGQSAVPQTPADMGHVWPLWRQNLTDIVPQLFQPRGR